MRQVRFLLRGLQRVNDARGGLAGGLDIRKPGQVVSQGKIKRGCVRNGRGRRNLAGGKAETRRRNSGNSGSEALARQGKRRAKRAFAPGKRHKGGAAGQNRIKKAGQSSFHNASCPFRHLPKKHYYLIAIVRKCPALFRGNETFLYLPGDLFRLQNPSLPSPVRIPYLWLVSDRFRGLANRRSL